MSCVPHPLSVNVTGAGFILQWTYHLRASGAGEAISVVNRLLHQLHPLGLAPAGL